MPNEIVQKKVEDYDSREVNEEDDLKDRLIALLEEKIEALQKENKLLREGFGSYSIPPLHPHEPRETIRTSSRLSQLLEEKSRKRKLDLNAKIAHNS